MRSGLSCMYQTSRLSGKGSESPQVSWRVARRQYTGTYLGGLVAAIPVPRTPRCYTHCVWHAGCPDCCDQRRAEQTAAKARLEAERRRVEAGAL